MTVWSDGLERQPERRPRVSAWSANGSCRTGVPVWSTGPRAGLEWRRELPTGVPDQGRPEIQASSGIKSA